MKDLVLEEPKISFSDISVKYLDSIDSEISKNAWQNSRPNRLRLEATSEDVLAEDLPVLDLYQIALELRVPAFIRDAIALITGVNMWSSSTRVDRISEGWDLLSGSECYLPFYKLYWQKMKTDFKRQDDARLMIPLTYMGTIIVATSYRTWVKFCKTLEILESKSVDLMKPVLSKTREQILNALREASKVEPRTEYFRPLDIFEQGSLKEGIELQVCFNLYSQLIRHRRVLVESSLGDKIANGSVMEFNQANNINIRVYAPEKVWNAILITRNCWAAHYRIWSSIRDQLPKKNERPCDLVNLCPYELEMKGRVSGLDPNPPCPIYLKMNKIPQDNFIEKILSMIELDQRNIKDWKKFLD